MINVNKGGFKKAIALLEDFLFEIEYDKSKSKEHKKHKILQARNLNPEFDLELAIMICGDGESNFPYRSSFFLSKFFNDLGFNYNHDGSTRRFWVKDTLSEFSIHELLIIIEKGLFNKWDFRKDDKLNSEDKFKEAIKEFQKLIDDSLIKENPINLDEILSIELPTNSNSKKKIIKEMKEIFVTYRWENQRLVDRVLSFVNYLRKHGYEAEVDQFLSQQQSATDFYEMMHRGMTDYHKVIIVLSPGYKERAEKFEGGVGNEYSLIIKDIKDNPNKYILVSFYGISESITPLSFKGREIIDLSKTENFNKLHSKLQDEDIIEFSPVGDTKPPIKKIRVADFESTEQNKIEILDINSAQTDASTLSNKIKHIKFNLEIGLKNGGANTIKDYNIEVELPRLLTEFESSGRVENGNTIYSFDENPKLFPRKTIRLEKIKLIVNNRNLNLAYTSFLSVRVFSDDIFVEREFQISELLYRNNYGNKEFILKEDFLT